MESHRTQSMPVTVSMVVMSRIRKITRQQANQALLMRSGEKCSARRLLARWCVERWASHQPILQLRSPAYWVRTRDEDGNPAGLRNLRGSPILRSHDFKAGLREHGQRTVRRCAVQHALKLLHQMALAGAKMMKVLSSRSSIHFTYRYNRWPTASALHAPPRVDRIRLWHRIIVSRVLVTQPSNLTLVALVPRLRSPWPTHRISRHKPG